LRGERLSHRVPLGADDQGNGEVNPAGGTIEWRAPNPVIIRLLRSLVRNPLTARTNLSGA